MLLSVVIVDQPAEGDPVVTCGSALLAERARAAGDRMLEARGVPKSVRDRWAAAEPGTAVHFGSRRIGLVETPDPATAFGPINAWVKRTAT